MLSSCVKTLGILPKFSVSRMASGSSFIVGYRTTALARLGCDSGISRKKRSLSGRFPPIFSQIGKPDLVG
jgi:hypothetical protein